MRPNTSPFAILSALRDEQVGLEKMFSEQQIVTQAGRQFRQGYWRKQPAILARSGVGKVAAATTATILIERFGAEKIIFTGVAGGVGEGVQIGDVVVGTHTVQHDMDASPLFPRFEIPLYHQALFEADPPLEHSLVQAAKAYAATRSPTFRVHRGLIASGDQFIHRIEQVTALRQALPSVLCVEMEGAAVAQVCQDYGVPFVAIRTISDRADAKAHQDFPQFLREVASPYAEGIMQAWFAHQTT